MTSSHQGSYINHQSGTLFDRHTGTFFARPLQDSIDQQFTTESQAHLSFNADSVDVGNGAAFNNNADETIMFWFSPTSDFVSGSSGQGIFNKNAAGNNNGDIYIHLGSYGGMGSNDGKLYFTLDNGSSMDTISSTSNSWTAGQWYHCAILLGSSGRKIYINGTQETSAVARGDSGNNGASLVIGASSFKGKIDEVAIYSRALEVEEIQAHYYRRQYASTEPTVSLGTVEVQ